MLHGKTALVTGSTSGIGLGIAKALAAQGANIVLNGFGDAQGPQAEVAALGAQVAYHGADMSKPGEIEEMVQHAAKIFGKVDILVNNAGIQHVARIENFPVDRWDAIIAINLSSAFHATRLALPAMQANNWGRIINLASVHGLVGSAEKSAYVAAKHGVVGLTKVTALENATGCDMQRHLPRLGAHTPGPKTGGRQGDSTGHQQRRSHPTAIGRKGALNAVHNTRRTGCACGVFVLPRWQQRAGGGLEYGRRMGGAVTALPKPAPAS